MEDDDISDEQVEQILRDLGDYIESEATATEEFVTVSEQIVALAGRPMTEDEARIVWEQFHELRLSALLYSLWKSGRITIGLSEGEFRYRAVMPPE